LQDHPKFTQSEIFGLKTNHLATLDCETVIRQNEGNEYYSQGPMLKTLFSGENGIF
jgi:hypothetical protein